MERLDPFIKYIYTEKQIEQANEVERRIAQLDNMYRSIWNGLMNPDNNEPLESLSQLVTTFSDGSGFYFEFDKHNILPEYIRDEITRIYVEVYHLMKEE